MISTVMSRTHAEDRRQTQQEREAAHETKIIEAIRSRIREARRSRITGDLVFTVRLNKGGPTQTYTEIGTVYKILED